MNNSTLEAMYKKCGSAITAVYGASNNNDVEDAVQEGMIAIWQATQETTTGNTDAWLVQRGVYKARDYLRSRVWRHENRTSMSNDDPDVIEENDGDLLGTYYATAEEEALDHIAAQEILAPLPADTRSAVVLLALDYSTTEVGKELGVSAYIVRKRIEEARRILSFNFF